jgi:hypothetical protein
MSIENNSMTIKWLDEPQKHNYPGAVSHLSLTMSEEDTKSVVGNMKSAGISEFAAKDITRSPELSLFGISNTHIRRDIGQIVIGKKLSPLLF